WPTSVCAAHVPQRVTLDGQLVATIDGAPPTTLAHPIQVSHAAVAAPGPPHERMPLGRVAGARSGDKAGNANVGVWVESDAAYAWLAATLTVECFRQLVPEAAGLNVQRFELPNLRALNFVVQGLLGRGVGDSTRYDPQAKGLGELLRAQHLDVPTAIL